MCGGLGSGAVRVGEVVFCLCTWENVRGGMRIEKGMANVSSGPEWILSTVPLDGQSVCLFICFFFFRFFLSVLRLFCLPARHQLSLQ